MGIPPCRTLRKIDVRAVEKVCKTADFREGGKSNCGEERIDQTCLGRTVEPVCVSQNCMLHARDAAAHSVHPAATAGLSGEPCQSVPVLKMKTIRHVIVQQMTEQTLFAHELTC